MQGGQGKLRSQRSSAYDRQIPPTDVVNLVSSNVACFLLVGDLARFTAASCLHLDRARTLPEAATAHAADHADQPPVQLKGGRFHPNSEHHNRPLPPATQMSFASAPGRKLRNAQWILSEQPDAITNSVNGGSPQNVARRIAHAVCNRGE